MHVPLPLPLPLLLLLLLLLCAASSGGSQSQAQEQAPGPLVPVAPAAAELGAMAPLALYGTGRRRRRLGGSFQLCAPCTCCGGGSGTCILSACCYAINCNIPNRPFGYCSFTPRSCDCLGCNL